MQHFMMLKRILLILIFVWIYASFLVIADDATDCSKFPQFVMDTTQTSAIISLINNAKNLLDDAKMFARIKAR